MANTGIFDNELILPGVITEIIPDYAQDYDTSAFGTTESVTIIGTAFNGPVGKVVPIYSPEHAKYIFGDSFDTKTRREASLVAEIFDAWGRGCRTIYAIRVSGKEICKDYGFATETKLKLRVSGIFPSNDNKNVFLNYAATQNANDKVGTIKIFKPAERSTVKEKIQGLSFTQNEMLVSDVKLSGYGITKDSRLVDVINIVNNAPSNNVIRLAIVNEHGADVTASSKEAQSLSLGVMFPGIYTIGRDKMASEVEAKTEIGFVLSSQAKPHENYMESVWKELLINTDVSTEYPLFGKSINDFIALVGMQADANGDWLKPIGMIDKITIKDKKDYEEVELNEFDLYKRLGSGFVETAQIVELKTSDNTAVRGYKVSPPNSNDPNRVIGIMDGIYSMLENHSTNFTVLAGVSAESKINGKLPRKEEFRKVNSNPINLTSSSATVLEATVKIDRRDFSPAKKCEITITKVAEANGINQERLLASINTEIKAQRIVSLASDNATEIAALPEKSLLVTIAKEDSTMALCTIKNKKAVKINANGHYVIEKDNKLVLVKSESGVVTADETIEESKSIICVCGNIANVYTVKADKSLEPIACLSQIANSELEEDYTVCHIEELPNKINVKVFSTEANWMNYGELADKLNGDKLFSELVEIVAKEADKEVGDTITGTGTDKKLNESGALEIAYDTTMYIPYTTSDNFARHLAQHCTYTSLKTFPTHGVIGCTKLNGVNLSTVADRVNEILSLDLDLYAKRPNGNNMLDSDNMPYPIGRCISVPFIQYPVTTGNGYSYISNGAAGYAGTVSILPADRSSTNQPTNIPNPSFELSNYQLSKLTAKGIVTVKRTVQGLVITDGVTMAPVDSAYRRLSTTKVINIVDEELKKVMTPFIGLQNNLTTKNSLETAITSKLNKLSENLIQKYKFKIVADPALAKLGIIKIQYVVIPTNEIKEIRGAVSVQENN